MSTPLGMTWILLAGNPLSTRCLASASLFKTKAAQSRSVLRSNRRHRSACDLKSQSLRLGELRSAVDGGLLTADAPVAELGAIINGLVAGRTDARQTTVCDLTGVGVQDTMIAINTLRLAEAANIGLTL